jgi:hypothetical protein
VKVLAATVPDRNAVRRLFPPEIPEPHRSQFGVPHGVLNVLVPEVGLERPRVVPLVGKCVPACVPQHVWVDLEGQLGTDTRAFNHSTASISPRDGPKIKSIF